MSVQKQKQKKHLLRSSLLVGSITMLSRVMGLVRDIVIAVFFGSSASADAFFIAFRIPNFLRRLFAEGAFSQAFVPVLSEYKTTRDQQDVKDLIDHVFGTLGMILIIVSLAGILAAPLLIYVFAPGFYQMPEKLELAGQMLQITFPYILFISLTAFAGAILNVCDRFAVSAFTPVLLNLSLIGAAIVLAPHLNPPVMALAWGVALAGISQLLLQAPFLSRLGLLPRPRWGWRHSGVQRVLTLMLPALLAVSASQISLLLDSILASFLQTGSVSWLYYSDRLIELPVGIFGVAIGSVILPDLSKQYAASTDGHFSKTLDWAIRLILLISIPATVALVILAEPLLSTIFYHGEMADRDVYMASGSLRAFASGLSAFMLIKVLAPGYFARQNTVVPVKIAIKALIFNMILNLILIWPLKHVGLALATSLSSGLNAWLLYRGLRKEHIFTPQSGWRRFFIQVSVAVIAMGAMLTVFSAPTEQWLNWDSHTRVIHMLLLVISGKLVYMSCLFLTGLRWKDLQY